MSEAGTAGPPKPDGLNRVMITASVMMATTVIIMDMSIASIALPHMQGGLSANQDQISWVMTIYFMMQGITMSATGSHTDDTKAEAGGQGGDGGFSLVDVQMAEGGFRGSNVVLHGVTSIRWSSSE